MVLLYQKFTAKPDSVRIQITD